MYYFIRNIILVVFFLIFLSTILCQKKKGTNRSKKAVIIKRVIIISFVVAAVCVFIPFEAPFIRFNSTEASVKYSTAKPFYEDKAVETDKTAFFVSHKSNNWTYGSAAKYDNKYGFCGYHSKTILTTNSITVDEENFDGSFNVSKVINYDTNEKCYFIKFINLLDFENKEKQNSWDSQDNLIDFEKSTPMEKLTFKDNRTVYAAVTDQIDEKMTLVFCGEKYEFD